MPIYLPDEADLNVFDLIVEVLETVVGPLLISILELAAVGKVELVILHLLHYLLLVLPVGLDLLQVYRGLPALYPLQHLLVLQANGLLLPLPKGHVQALVPPRPLFPLRHRLHLLLADAVDLVEEQLVVVGDLAVPVLPHAGALAVVDEDRIGVLHQPGCDGLDTPQVEQVMGIGDLDFLELDQPIDVGYRSIHG